MSVGSPALSHCSVAACVRHARRGACGRSHPHGAAASTAVHAAARVGRLAPVRTIGAACTRAAPSRRCPARPHTRARSIPALGRMHACCLRSISIRSVSSTSSTSTRDGGGPARCSSRLRGWQQCTGPPGAPPCPCVQHSRSTTHTPQIAVRRTIKYSRADTARHAALRRDALLHWRMVLSARVTLQTRLQRAAAHHRRFHAAAIMRVWIDDTRAAVRMRRIEACSAATHRIALARHALRRWMGAFARRAEQHRIWRSAGQHKDRGYVRQLVLREQLNVQAAARRDQPLAAVCAAAAPDSPARAPG